jgi:ankyrin repeat protein
VDTLRRAKARQCRELMKHWRRNIATASMEMKECSRFLKEYHLDCMMIAATRLHDAVERGEIDKLKQLLPGHPNINVKDRRGWTALHWAVQEGKLEALETLIAAGLDPDARDKHGATPMHLASFAGEVEIVVRLADVADINAHTESGATPLHAAVLGGHVKVVRVLLERGAAAGAEDNFGRTPSFYAKIVQDPELEKIFAEQGK